MKVQLLPFQPQDLELICSLEKISFSKISAIPSKQLCAMILHNDVLCYCLKTESNDLIAYILLKIEKIRHSIIILSLAVQKKHQRIGLGSLLLDFCKTISKDLRLDTIKVQIENSNKKSQKLLEKAKFKFSEEFQNYLKEGNKGLEFIFELE